MSTGQLPTRILNRLGFPLIPLDDLAGVLEHIPLPVLLLDADGQIVALNHRLASLTGHAPERLRGAPHTLIGCDLPTRQTRYATTLRHHNRREIPCQAQSFPLGTDYWLIVLEAEASQKTQQIEKERARTQFRAIQTLFTSLHNDRSFEARLQRILEGGRRLCGAESLLYYRLDGLHPRAYLAARAGAHTDLPEALVIRGQKQPEVWRPGDPPRSALLRRAAQLGYAYVAQAPIGESHAMVGLLVAVHASADPLPDLLEWLRLTALVMDQALASHGQIVSLLTTVQEAREEVARLQAALERVQDGVLLLDANRRIVQVNPAVCALLGYRQTEMIGRPANEILGLETWPDEGSTTVTLLNRHGDPLTVTLTCHTPVNTPEAWTLCILNDRTQIAQTQLEMKQLHQRAMMGQLSGVLAHEIRNPLNNMHLALQTLASKPDLPDSIRQRVNEVIEEQNRLLRLVNDMLSMQKHTQSEMTHRLLRVNPLVQDVIRFFTPRANRYGVEIHLSLADGLPPIRGNPEALRQVLLNLMDNALNAMRDQGKGILGIRTQAATDEGGKPVVEIHVADTGPGIPDTLRDRIFTLGVTGREDGTGIGLAISRQIISQHQGSLTLMQSAPAATIFRIRLPALLEETS